MGPSSLDVMYFLAPRKHFATPKLVADLSLEERTVSVGLAQLSAAVLTAL